MPKKLLRWVSWSVGILLVLVFVAALGVHYYTRTPQFRALLRAKILAAANDALNGELRFKEITGSVWRDLEFHDFAIVQNGETILSAPVVSIDVGLWGQVIAFLSSSTIRIGQIDIVEPELKLVQDEEKNWNLAKLVKKQDKPEEAGQQPQSMTISLRNIRIKDGKLQARTADGKEARITALSGEADIDLPPSGPEINLNKLGFALSSSGVPDSTWSTALSLKQNDKTSSLEIKGLSIATARSRLDISGTIDNFSSPITKLSLDLTRLSAEEIRQLSPAVPLREDIAGRIRASGPLSALQVSATFTAPIGQMTLSSQLQNRRVAFTAQSEEKNGTAELQAAVVLSDTPSYEANLRTRAFDLKKIAAQKPGLPAAKINIDAWVKGHGTKPDT